jgi:hypothetical protein
MIHHDSCFRPLLLVVLSLCLGLLDWLGDLVCLLCGSMAAGFDEFVLSLSVPQRSEAEEVKPYITKYYTALLEYLWLVVVVDTEFREEHLVLVGRVGPFQSLLSLYAIHATHLDQGPESSIVKVVDVTWEV